MLIAVARVRFQNLIAEKASCPKLGLAGVASSKANPTFCEDMGIMHAVMPRISFHECN